MTANPWSSVGTAGRVGGFMTKAMVAVSCRRAPRSRRVGVRRSGRG